MQVLFSGLMGLRISELNGLKYTDVYGEKKEIIRDYTGNLIPFYKMYYQ